MAYIQQRNAKDGTINYRVQIRLKGFPMQTVKARINSIVVAKENSIAQQSKQK